jgi:AraC family transcriptional regulator of adaptative response/methylated-DNA-[protein]-cysteine methyltransferase
MRISFTTVPTSLGLILIAATDRGVCSIAIGDDQKVLEKNLRTEYPKATLIEPDNRLADWAKRIVRHVAGDATELDLPIDVPATAFQRRVWKALQQIPYGDTRSYTEIARSIGEPSAVRAVARAIASNRVALVVPCHRVIRGNGELSGYRWGAEKKRRLLSIEAQCNSPPTAREEDRLTVTR